MEIKKYPKMDLESRKTTYVLTGLAGALAILFIALEWSSTSRRNNNLIGRSMMDETEEDMIITVQTATPPPPPPPPVADVIEQFKIVEEDIEIADYDIEPIEDNDTRIEIINLENYGPNDIEEPDDMDILPIAEQQPEFPGGQTALMAFIKKNLRYPAFAAENGIQGKAVLAFVVEKDGSIAGIEIMRSPAEELSKEAIRVVQQMPKWKPGKQHGKPVRVKFVLPITFRLS